MIGPLTLQVGKAVDEFTDMLCAKMAREIMAGKQEGVLHMSPIPVFIAANAVYRGETAHPRVLWGDFWFLYYQAWLWRCSKGWREGATEVWLRRLHDKGELEQLLMALHNAVGREQRSWRIRSEKKVEQVRQETKL